MTKEGRDRARLVAVWGLSIALLLLMFNVGISIIAFVSSDFNVEDAEPAAISTIGAAIIAIVGVLGTFLAKSRDKE